MKIGIVGASGLVGWNLRKCLLKKGCEVFGTYHSRKKEGLVRFDLVSGEFDLFDGLDAVVIAGGMTRLDDCVKDRVYSRKVNVERTVALISSLAEMGIKPVFLSSEQVFEGTKGNYRETDETSPLTFYGRMKREVEKYMEKNLDEYLVFRLSKTYSRNLEDGGIFAETVCALQYGKKVKAAWNLFFNPTDVTLVCNGIINSLKKRLNGIFHLADKRVMSRYDFILSIADEMGFDRGQVEAIDINGLELMEKRPLNTSLNVEKINRELYERL